MMKNQQKKVKESVADAKQVKKLEAKISAIEEGKLHLVDTFFQNIFFFFFLRFKF